MDTDYPEARERWTLRNQVMDDNKTKILSPLKVQSHGMFFLIFLEAHLTQFSMLS